MLESFLFSSFVINETSCCFSQQIHHKVNFPVGHYLSALRMVNKHYVQKHVSYYYHAHYFYILNDIFVTLLRIPVTSL